MTAKRKRAPGKGERIALSGYVPQTHYQIELILEHMLQDELEQFELASLQAGIADDLILFLTGKRIKAYQFKHHSEGFLTFADLIDSVKNKPRLLHQISQAWQKIKVLHQDRQIEIILVTNVPASIKASSQKRAADSFDALDRTLKNFLDQVWHPFRLNLAQGCNGYDIVPLAWNEKFSEWREATGLSKQDFSEFAQSFNILTAREPHPERRLADEQDINSLYHWFQQLIAERASSNDLIRITDKELKDYLGADRFTYRNRHVFPITSLYDPIEATREKLLQSIERYTSGYVAVLGSPGSGKSSLLERSLRAGFRPHKVIPYYAFLPDDGYIVYSRLEATNFLHDLIKRIEEGTGNKNQVLPRRDELPAQRGRLAELLLYLGQEFAKTGQRTIILVDGLDHVERPGNEDVALSMLSALPEPHQIPKGVLFILGSQYLKLKTLSSSIQSHIRKDADRQIEMARLSNTQVERIIEKAGVAQSLKAQTNEYVYRQKIDKIGSISEGHPLALGILVNRLRDALMSGDNIDNILEQTPKYQESIYNQYEYLWTRIEESNRPRMRELVGQVARLWPDIDFRWVRTWDDLREPVQEFENHFKHLFVKVAPNRWRFFHNSFRLFLLDKSIETIDGPDPSDGERYHQKLAERCEACKNGSEHGWQLTYHLSHSGKLDKLFEVATASWFEKEYMEFRPAFEIAKDAHLCLRRAVQARKPHLIARFLLLWHRYRHAGNILAESKQEDILLELLLDCGLRNIAIHRVFAEYRLFNAALEYDRIRQHTEMLSLIDRFAECGETEFSAVLLDKCEPREILDGEKEADCSHDHIARELIELFESWAILALRFHDASTVLARLNHIRWHRRGASDSVNQSTIELSKKEQYSLIQEILIRVAKRLLIQKRWDSFDQIIRCLEKPWWNKHTIPFWWGEIMVEALHVSKEDLAREERYRDHIVNRLSAEDVGNTIKRLRKKIKGGDGIPFEVAQTINLAVVLLPDEDAAIKYGSLFEWTEIRSIIVRELRDHSATSSMRLDPLENYITLQIFIGVPLPAPGILANDLLNRTGLYPERREALFAMIIARIRAAALNGFALRYRVGKTVDLYECKEHFFYLTTYFNRLRERDFEFSYLNGPAFVAEVLTKAIKSASVIGNDTLQVLVDQVKTAWSDQKEKSQWSDELRYSVLSALKSNPNTCDWVRSEFVKSVDAPVKCEGDTYSWIEKRIRRAHVLLWLNRKEAVLEELKMALLCAFGIRSENDYQVATFMEWLPLAVEMTTNDDERRILLEEATQQILMCRMARSGADEAAQSVITATALWSPRRACQLLHELFRDLLGGRSIPEGVAAFIRGCLSIENNATDKLSSSVLASLTGLFNTLCLGSETYRREILDLAHDLVVAAPLVGKVDRKEVARRIWSAAYFAMPDGEDRQRLANVLSHALPNPKDQIEAGLFPEDIPKPESPHLREGTEQPYPLELQDGRKLHREEVITLILENPKVMADLAKGEKNDPGKSYRYFDWGKVLRIISPHLTTADQNQAIAGLLAAGNRSYDLFAFIRRLAVKGELIYKAEAQNAAQEVISKEDVSYGWVRRFDGGVRLAALGLLVILNTEKYQSVAYDQLDQALSGRMYIDGLITWTKELLQLFVTYDELKPTAVEITKHRKGIFKGLDEVPSKALDAFRSGLPKATSDTVETAICSFLLEQLGSPVRYISKRAMTELVWLYEVDQETVENEIRWKLREDDEIVQERILLLCERLVRYGALRSLRNELEDLSKSENYAVAESARRILQVQGITTPPNHNCVRITNIAVPQEQRLLIPGENDYDREIDLNRVFEPWFRVLADIRRIPQKHLEDGVRGIRVSLGWDSLKLETANQLLMGGYHWVRSNFERFSGITTRLALQHYVERLIKVGTLPYPLHGFLDNWFRAHDPDLTGWWPSRRLTWIPPFADDPEKHSSKEDAIYWCQNVNNETVNKRFVKRIKWSAPGEKEDEWVVLGEKSMFEAGDQFRRVEERQSLWIFDSTKVQEATKKLQQHKEIFHEMHGFLFSEYKVNISNLEKVDPKAILILNQTFDFQIVTSNWLAILPSIMQNLECTLDSTFPPCWRDKRRETACVSIGWQDGTWKHRNYDRHSPAGKGWCVLMRAELWQEIEKNLGGKAIFLTGVRRELYQPSESPYEAICTKVVVESESF